MNHAAPYLLPSFLFKKVGACIKSLLCRALIRKEVHHFFYVRETVTKRWLFIRDNTVSTLTAETFAGRNFREFCDFGLFSRKLMPSKRLNERFAKVTLAKINFSKNRESFF